MKLADKIFTRFGLWVKIRLWRVWFRQKIDSMRVDGKYSFGVACIGSPEGAAAQQKPNREILAAPE
jgi:hypothetical protein